MGIIEKNVASELELLPQGDKVPADAQEYKDELNRIKQYVVDLREKCKKECNSYSEDVKYWAEYRTGIKEFTPWLTEAEKASGEGPSKPTNLSEAEALFAKSSSFDNNCVAHLKLLNAANDAAQRMTTHKEADVEVAALKERYNKVKSVSDEWRAKVETLVKDKTAEGENQFSLEKMESTLGELKNIFKQKEK